MYRFPVDKAVPSIGALAVAAHQHVDGKRGVAVDPAHHPVSGHMRKPTRADRCWRHVEDFVPMQKGAAMACRPQTGQHLGKLRLTVAGDTRNADDLAGSNGKIHGLQSSQAPVIASPEIGVRQYR